MNYDLDTYTKLLICQPVIDAIQENKVLCHVRNTSGLKYAGITVKNTEIDNELLLMLVLYGRKEVHVSDAFYYCQDADLMENQHHVLDRYFERVGMR